MIHIKKINEIVNGELFGNDDLYIKGPCSIVNSKEGFLTYIKNPKYLESINTTFASAIIVDKSVDIPKNSEKTILKVDNPSLAFLSFLKYFDSTINKEENNKISKLSNINKGAKIGKDVFIGDNVIIQDEVQISDNVRIESNTVIEHGSTIGRKSIIKANVTIHKHSVIGEKCKIKSGSIIGSIGFGLVTDNQGIHHHIPHLGKVVIENNVLIGSNCTIDKGTIDNTKIGQGTKFDNQVHIGHNVSIGKNCIICAQVGIGGSTKICDNVIVGGQAGIIDNLLIEDNVTIGPTSYVIKSIKKNSYFSGNPARNHKDHIRQDIIVSKLPKMYKKIFK